MAPDAEALGKEGLKVDLEVLVDHEPAEGILAFLEESGADLVAMATHGRGGVARLVLGSVADRVVRSGRTPVLLHRAT